MEQNLEKQLTETTKLGFDLFKHLATLSTGAIVLLGTLLGPRLPNLEWKGLLYFAYGCFFLCVLFSVGAMWAMVQLSVPGPRSQVDSLADKILALCSSTAAGTFHIFCCPLLCGGNRAEYLTMPPNPSLERTREAWSLCV